MKRSIDWLQGEPRGDAKLHTAVLVLKELAMNSPTLFSPLIPAFFDHIWVAIQSDGKSVVREAAVEALRAVLAIIATRTDETYRDHWFRRVAKQTSEGFAMTDAASIHGSLLVVGELLRNTGSFMRAQFQETCKIVFDYRSHGHRLVQRAVIQLLPQLAHFSPELFIQRWLEPCIAHLVLALRSGGEHYEAALASVGELALAVGPAITPHTPQLVEMVSAALAGPTSAAPPQARPRRHGQDSSEALRCVSKLAKAVGPSIAPQIETLVDQMFAAGLSQPLLDVLGELARSTPSLLPVVQTRLLTCIAAVLAGPRSEEGAACGMVSMASATMALDPSSANDENTVELALRALAAFGSDDPRARSVANCSALWYFEHESPQIRREAALTVTRLLLPSPDQLERGGCVSQIRSPFLALGCGPVPAADPGGVARTGGLGSSRCVVICQTHQLLAVAALLQRALNFSVSDPDPYTRRKVFESLDARFDAFLCEPHCVTLLAQALHDEDVSVRKAVAQIMGRLTQHNPAYVVPAMRKLLIQVLTELEYAAEERQKEEAAQLLSTLSAHARQFVEPYMSTILRLLLKKLREAITDGSLKLGANLLEAVGELSEVSGQELKPFLNDLLLLVVDTIQDQGAGASNLKREQLSQAYRALRMVVENTGYVVELYTKYPSLLPFLIDVLRSDVHTGDWQQRQHILRCIGTLGALDPAKFQKLVRSTKGEPVGDGGGGPAAALLEGEPGSRAWPWHLAAGGVLDDGNGADLLSAHAVAALLKMLTDSSLAPQHAQVVQVLMKIFKGLEQGCVPFLPQIMAAFLQVIRALGSPERQALLRHLADLVRIAGPRMGDYLEAIFDMVRSVWQEAAAAAGPRADDGVVDVTLALLALLEEISRCHRDPLKAHLGQLLPTILGLLHQYRPEQQPLVRQALHALVVFGHALGDFLHLVILALVRVCQEEELDASGQGPSTREYAIRALGELSKVLHFPHLLGRVVHPLLRILESPASPGTLRQACVDTLEQFSIALGTELAMFEPQIRRALARHARQPGERDQPLSSAEPLPPDFVGTASATGNSAMGRTESLVMESCVSEPFAWDAQPNQHSLRQAWEASHRSTKDDWVEWMRRFALELLRESPSPALQACWSLGQVYYPLARDLFHASFLSCWLHLYDAYQDLLVRSLETALHSPNLPPDILQTLLNLAEFMDRVGLPLPIDARTLGGFSEQCHAYAKALHYKETEFTTSPAACVEAMISINTQLQQTAAAQGILVYAQKSLNVELREPWYERLQRWEDALEAYEIRQLEDPDNVEWTTSRLRCLHELGEWPRLSQLARFVCDREDVAISDTVKQEIAPLAAAAEFHMRDWDRMGFFVDALEGARNPSYEGLFYSAILAIHRESYRRAGKLISKARETLDPELTALVGESYTRAYRSLVKVQQLVELEEIIKYKTTDREQTRQGIREMWSSRLQGCQNSVDVWQAALQIRSIVIPPQEDVTTWLQFSALCRRFSRVDLAVKALDQLCSDPIVARDPRVIVGSMKNLYAAGFKRQAFQKLRDFLAGRHASGAPAQLLSRCNLKMGLWTREVYEEENRAAYVTSDRVLHEVLHWLEAAVELNGDYKAWNAFALANFQAVEAMEARAPSEPAALGRRLSEDFSVGASERCWPVSGTARSQRCTPHVVHAVRGFVKSVALARRPALQDILRLLTLWFNYAGAPEVEPALEEGFQAMPLSAWLQVVPQILARLRSPNVHLRKTINELLGRMARAYPQAVVFPLTVATKSTVESVASSARQLLQGMRDDGSEVLVRESEMVSEELIRISILWHERWCEALEEASRLYYAESDPKGMIKVLQPLHEQMQRVGPQTMREIAFQQAFSRELQEAWRCIQRYEETGSKVDTDQAWQSYYKVFQKIRKQVQGLSHLDMQSVSPLLLNARCLELAVPGTYSAESGAVLVTIASFSPSIEVVTSKQRPRILQLSGSDGRSYQFLLKGHEDLKQDERVMQLFGLINCLLAAHEASARAELSIARFAVVPLSTNSGLIEWVPRCDTLHQLIKMYRKSRHVELSVEYQLMRSMCARCEDLSLLQKVEVFRYALQCTSGVDLQRVLWLQSRNSEVWLSRRTTYCRSLAVMSVVGYILGLGDRHPSNLMIARESGQVVHIDFGDCFEIAAFREKFPEKIPFRLTRMLLNALEVSGVEGNYRYTCELVMSLLRNNKDAVMAMLEAFVFDPLITWRLLPTQARRGPVQPSTGHRPVGERGRVGDAEAVSDAGAESSHVRAGEAAGGAPGGPAAAAGEGPAAEERPLRRPLHERFVCDEPAGAERDPHLASVSCKQARQRELRQHLGPEGVHADPELLYVTAQTVISRVYAKLTGTDFRQREPLGVEAQVERLFQEATSHENLCQCYVGWCPFW